MRAKRRMAISIQICMLQIYAGFAPEMRDSAASGTFPAPPHSAYRRAHAEDHLQDLPGRRCGARPKAGRFDGAPIDLADGFIHFSTADAGAAKPPPGILPDRTALLLVAVDAEALGAALKYEPSRGGALFPHLYAPLDLARCIWAKPLPLGTDGAMSFRSFEHDRPVSNGSAGRRCSRFDPETAHGLSIAALKCGLPFRPSAAPDPRLEVRVAGLDFPNPLGMAAGYDKNAEVPDALLPLGFGFAEVGTVTPLPQAGNPKPRIFRLTADAAVINRLGFNNEGHDARRAAARGARGAGRASSASTSAPTRTAPTASRDYEPGVRALRRRSRPISPSTSPRPTRRACATCRRAQALAELLARASRQRATRREAPAARCRCS